MQFRFCPSGNPHNSHNQVRQTTSISTGVLAEIEELIKQGGVFPETREDHRTASQRLPGRGLFGGNFSYRDVPIVSKLTKIEALSVRLDFTPAQPNQAEISLSATYEPTKVPKLAKDESWKELSGPHEFKAGAISIQVDVDWFPEEPSLCVACGLIHPYLYPEAVVLVTQAEHLQIIEHRKRELGLT